MRKNQKGFTLVELIIAVAILAIVTAAVCGFIVVGSRSYASSNTDIMLQQDAQLALNQMSDVIIDTTDSISYGLSTSGSSDMQLVLKDSEFAGEATEKCLIVVNRHEDESNNDNPSYWFYWSKDDEIIYFNEVAAHSSTMTPDEIEHEFQNADTDKAILAQHVTDFSIDISQFEANRVVMISMTFENGNRTYSTSNNVTVRNRIALNEITVGPMKRAQDFEINTVRNVTLEPGEGLDLAALTHVESSSDDDALTWELVGGPQSGTSLSTGGYLTVGKAEIRQNFNVKVSRTNEEYTGQNDRVAQTIRVNVKRATSVEFNGPSTAKQGETVALTAWAEGNMLTQPCNGCVASEAALAMDRDVAGWEIIGDAEFVAGSTSTGGASVLIHNTATVGSTITVRAYSQLSWDKDYGPTGNPETRPVWGEWTIRVQKGASDTVPMPGDFIFGNDNTMPDGGHTIDWLTNGITKGTASEYVVYARVKDPIGGTPDRVAIYYTDDGQNIRFFPDIFGLKLDRTYDLYLQAILPVPNGKIDELVAGAPGNKDFSGEVHKYDSQIVDEIIHTPGTLDDLGKYIGTKFDAGSYFKGTISPPTISIKYNGFTYPDDRGHVETYSTLSSKDTVVGSIYLNEDGSMNIIAGESLNQQIYFGIYKGEGDSIDDWEFVAGYDPSMGELGGYYTENGSYKFKNTDMFYLQVQTSGNPLLTNDNYFKRNTSITDSSAHGTYHIVPGFIYANNPNVRAYNFLYRDFLNVADFNEHFYLQPDCTIDLNVGANLNMNVIYGGKSQGWINFPLPTQEPFTWYSGAEWEQTFYGNYDIYTTQNAGEKTGITISNPTVKCMYDSSTGIYRIQLKKVDNGNKGTVITDYGTYEWRPGDAEWSTYKPGDGITMGDNSTWGPLIYFTYQGQKWMMEMPVSENDNDWPFRNGPSTSQTRVFYRTDDWTAWYGQNAYFDLKWENEILTLSIGNGGEFIGTWKLSADGKSWNTSN